MADTSTVKKHAVDFTSVKDSSGINPKHQPEGDYLVKIIKVDETTKDDVPMWNFIMQLDDSKSATYPFYCKLQENQLWKLRNLLIACGFAVPKKRVSIDPNKLVGKSLGVTLADDEYEGKLKSVVDATFPASELDAQEPEDDDTEDDVEEDEVEEPAPRKKAKRKPEPEPEPEPEEEEEDEEDEEPAPPKRRAKAKRKPVEEDDDELDIDEL